MIRVIMKFKLFFQTQVAWTGQTFWEEGAHFFYINLFVDE
mgnify:CR=1 FL=1